MDIQGHRGCRGLYPENSIPAFDKAIELGVTTLELDVVLSKDFKVVVSHEPYLNSTICELPSSDATTEKKDVEWNLFQMNYDEIKQFDCGSKFHPDFPDQYKEETYKPLLSEVFSLVKSKKSGVWFNIEIKSHPNYYDQYIPKPDVYVSIVLALIEEERMLDRVNIQSFDINILEEVHQQYPEVDIALLVDENESVIEKLESLSFRPEIISPFFKLLDQKVVEDYHFRGYKVIPWTVNATEDLKTVISWGVDGIITDYPDRLKSLL